MAESEASGQGGQAASCSMCIPRPPGHRCHAECTGLSLVHALCRDSHTCISSHSGSDPLSVASSGAAVISLTMLSATVARFLPQRCSQAFGEAKQKRIVGFASRRLSSEASLISSSVTAQGLAHVTGPCGHSQLVSELGFSPYLARETAAVQLIA